MNWQQFKAETVAHYAQLGRNPAAKSYAWAQVNQMARERPDEWGDLPALVLEAVRDEVRQPQNPDRQ